MVPMREVFDYEEATLQPEEDDRTMGGSQGAYSTRIRQAYLFNHGGIEEA